VETTASWESGPSGPGAWNPAIYAALKRRSSTLLHASAIMATLKRGSSKCVVNSSAVVAPETCAQAATVWRQLASVRFLIRRPHGVCVVSGFSPFEYGGGESQDDG